MAVNVAGRARPRGLGAPGQLAQAHPEMLVGQLAQVSPNSPASQPAPRSPDLLAKRMRLGAPQDCQFWGASDAP